MSNIIKSGISSIPGVGTTKGNITYANDGEADFGPSSFTGFYRGVDRPTGGYVIYSNTTVGAPITAVVAHDDNELIWFLQSFGATGSTKSEVLAWANGTNEIDVDDSSTVGGGGGPQYTYLANFGSTPDSAACFSTNGLTNVTFDSGDIGTAGYIYADNMNSLSGGIYWVHDSVSGKVRGASYSGNGNNYMNFFGSYTTPC